MLRHVVLIRWNEGTTPEQVEAATAALRALPGQIPEILSYTCGPDVRQAEGNFDFALTGQFADFESFLAYRNHPAHQAVLADHLVPNWAQRVAVQFQEP